ncbi:unnamed protein product [Miscanthus lutarioriparius]|uniref:DUF4220 domain-containing protein n=1 Tax=Miscanthus lutarioriparius TaxID=422564 RepID=A0A811R8F8_9POAL|nr:unnamed protein product [Miscanthus lutarioriparius]
MAGAVYFWQQWDIQILVVLSFTLQVILLLSAGIRRREGSALLRTLLWLAYIMADYTAIYTLGHMSISSRSSDHQIMAFWAPFLLLHLGGPDTITAYAFQDNQLWLRHLLTLVVQVTGAAYVLIQFIVVGRNSSTLLAAAALMFFSGCLKYGERTWALKCGGLDNIANSQYKYEYNMMSSGAAFRDDGRRRRSPYHGREGGKRLDTEEVLLGAHYLRHFCRGLLADRPVMEQIEYEVVRQGIQLNGDMYLYELVEMQLSLMYDMLYTKAAVIHTWYGFCIRIISPLSAVAAFFLFQFSSKHASSSSRVDIIVTYVLLAGALVLEMASSLRAAGSSWACASFHARGWHRLCSAVLRIRRLLKAGSRRACLDSLGQYNLLDICTDAKDDLRGKIAKIIGLEDWWRKLHYSSTVPISDGLKTLVLGEIRRRGIQDRRNARGKWILKERGMYEDLRRVADDTEVDRSIIVWHVATDLYLSMCPEEEDTGTANGTIRDQIRVLSNYMLFLLVLHPYLLPGVVRSGRYKENYKYFNMLWWRIMGSTKKDTMDSSSSTIIKKIGEWQLPADSMYKYVSGVGVERHDDMAAYVDGSWLAGMLLGNRWSLPIADMLQVIAGVWVEMLCYAGYHCGEESHARKLSTGAEFINAVWLLLEHAEKHDRSEISAESLAALRELVVHQDQGQK